MPRISSFFGIVIWLYWKDHHPPQFHAQYNEHEVLITISDSSILSWSLPSRAYGLVMEWASLHQAESMENWNLIQQGLSPHKIAPLP